MAGQTATERKTKRVKLTHARPGDVLERRSDRDDVIVVQVLNVFTTTLPTTYGARTTS